MVQFKRSTKASIQSSKTQIGQLVTSIADSKVQNLGKLPSQLMANPRENASVVTLRSGKQLELLDGSNS